MYINNLHINKYNIYIYKCIHLQTSIIPRPSMDIFCRCTGPVAESTWPGAGQTLVLTAVEITWDFERQKYRDPTNRIQMVVSTPS